MFAYTSHEKEIIHVYKEVLSGDRSAFPSSWWQEDYGNVRALACTKYLSEYIVHKNPKNLTKQDFKQNKLGGMLNWFDGKEEIISIIVPHIKKHSIAS